MNILDSIAASVFVFILIGFDKYSQSEANPNITDGETSRLVYSIAFGGVFPNIIEAILVDEISTK